MLGLQNQNSMAKRSIRIEIITDEVPEATSFVPPPARSLLSRLGGISAIETSTAATNLNNFMQPRRQKVIAPHTIGVAPIGLPTKRQRLRTKKGPRRVKKSAMQLDKEIDDYQALYNGVLF